MNTTTFKPSKLAIQEMNTLIRELCQHLNSDTKIWVEHTDNEIVSFEKCDAGYTENFWHVGDVKTNSKGECTIEINQKI